MYLKKQRVNFQGLCRETNTENRSHLYTTSKMNKKTCKKRICGAFSVSFEYFLLCLLKKRFSNLNRIQYGYSVVFFDCQSRDYVTLDVIIILRIWQIFLDEDKWINGWILSKIFLKLFRFLLKLWKLLLSFLWHNVERDSTGICVNWKIFIGLTQLNPLCS